MKRFLKVIDCTEQLQVRENVVGFEKALGAVKVIKDQIQYRSQSLFNLARGYLSHNFQFSSWKSTKQYIFGKLLISTFILNTKFLDLINKENDVIVMSFEFVRIQI